MAPRHGPVGLGGSWMLPDLLGCIIGLQIWSSWCSVPFACQPSGRGVGGRKGGRGGVRMKANTATQRLA